MVSSLVILAILVFLPLSSLALLLAKVALGLAVLMALLGQPEDAAFAAGTALFAAGAYWLRLWWLRFRGYPAA